RRLRRRTQWGDLTVVQRVHGLHHCRLRLRAARHDRELAQSGRHALPTVRPDLMRPDRFAGPRSAVHATFAALGAAVHLCLSSPAGSRPMTDLQAGRSSMSRHIFRRRDRRRLATIAVALGLAASPLAWLTLPATDSGAQAAPQATVSVTPATDLVDG